MPTNSKQGPKATELRSHLGKNAVSFGKVHPAGYFFPPAGISFSMKIRQEIKYAIAEARELPLDLGQLSAVEGLIEKLLAEQEERFRKLIRNDYVDVDI
jgi:hypothetical protein